MNQLRQRRARAATVPVRFGIVLLASAAVQPACETATYTCEGEPFQCTWLLPEKCAAMPGCYSVAQPACESQSFGCVPPNVEPDKVCGAPTCYHDGQSCRPICERYEDQSQCESTSLACVWANGRCTTECNLLDTRSSCEQGVNCAWYSCAGTPKPCSEYSGDACPTELGCERVRDPLYTTQ